MRHEGRMTFSCPMKPYDSIEEAENKIIDMFKSLFGDEYDLEFTDSDATLSNDNEPYDILKTYIDKAMTKYPNANILCFIDTISNCITLKDTNTNKNLCVCDGQSDIINADYIDIQILKSKLTEWNIQFNL